MTARGTGRFGVHAVLGIAVALTFVPLFWMLGLSFKQPAEVFSNPLNPLTLRPTLENYRYVFETTSVLRQFLNSVVFAGGVTLGQLLIAIPAAYAFSRFRFAGMGWLFALMLLTLPVPFIVFYVPNYLLMSKLNLLNTYPGLILPQVASGYGIFLLRQHFKAFPQDVTDAARMDGAGDWRILWSIVLPANRAAVAALGVFVFITTWNEYVWPLLVASEPKMQILTVGIANLASGEAGHRWGAIMAAAALATVPALIGYLVVRRQILAMVLEGAVKG